MKKLIFFAVCCVFLSSCAHHMYDVENYNISETQVVLNGANFRVVGQVEGSANATYVLYIGGLSKKALKGNALADMYRNANLKGSQTIINVSFKARVSGAPPFYTQIEYTASGVIIEFIDASPNSDMEEKPKGSVSQKSVTQDEKKSWGLVECDSVSAIEVGSVSQKSATQDEKKSWGLVEYNGVSAIEVGSVSQKSAKQDNKKSVELVEYNGVSAIVVKEEGDKVVLVAERGQLGTWEEAKLFCESLGKPWGMPSVKDLNAMRKEIGKIIGEEGCWTIEQVGETKAKAYFVGYLFPTTISPKEHKYTIISVARVDARDVMSE